MTSEMNRVTDPMVSAFHTQREQILQLPLAVRWVLFLTCWSSLVVALDMLMLTLVINLQPPT
jgi:hypothetical protein